MTKLTRCYLYTLCLLGALSLLSTLSATSLTLYNNGFGVVRETIPVELKEGHNKVQFSGVTNSVQTDTVILRDPNGKADFSIIEQNYRNDPLNTNTLLKKYEGKTIDFKVRYNDSEKIVPGTLIRTGNHEGEAIIELDGKWQFGVPGTPLFPPLDDGTLLKPTLQWNVYSQDEQTFDSELTYMTSGFSWKADYNLVSEEGSDIVDITGWVTLDNYTGATFEDTKIKLIAGDVNKISEPTADPFASRATVLRLTSAPAPEVTQKSFDEFHLYTLPLSLNFHDGESKQVEFIRAEGVHAKRLYIYDATKGNDVGVYREFMNTQANNLGMPLPAGIVRFYSEDSDDKQLEFVGENRIDHTPKNERIRVKTGDAFDIVGERKAVKHKNKSSMWSSSSNSRSETFEIKIRNRKDEPITVNLVEHAHHGANWKITESSETYEKTDANTFEFTPTIQPNQERTITYTIYYWW